MKNIRYIITAICLMGAGSIVAQNLNSAYFLDGYSYGYQLNPAKEYDRKGVFSFPLLCLGNTNMSVGGNLNYTDIFYKLPNGKMGTMMHPSVSASEALGNISSRERLNTDMRIDLLNVGFHAFKGYNFITVGLRANVTASVPYEMFEMAKTLRNKNYNIGEVGVQSTSWVEIALGHSHQVTESWRVGGAFKLLLGAGRADLRAKNLTMQLAGENQWIMTSDAEIEVSAKGMTWGKYKNNYDGTPEHERRIDFDNADISKAGVGGVGIAFDLGTEWDLEKAGLVKGLKVSAALLDLGFISWNNTLRGKSIKNQYTFNGFNNIKVKDGEGTTMKSQFDDFTDGIEDLYNFQDQGNDNGARALGATLNIGIQYKMPFYDKLDVGLLSTTRIQGMHSWNEERLSANVHPLKWLEGGINFGFGSLGTSFGWVINVHTKGFSLYAGMDRVLGTLSKQYIPLRSNGSFSFGISFPLGDKL